MTKKSTTDLTGRVGWGQQLYWEYTILGTKDSRDMSSGVKIILLQVWSFSQSNLPDRKRVEEVMLLKVTKIYILGTFSLEERLHTKLFPDRKETTEIIALSYSQVMTSHDYTTICLQFKNLILPTFCWAPAIQIGALTATF